jgi:hypothetical protein
MAMPGLWFEILKLGEQTFQRGVLLLFVSGLKNKHSATRPAANHLQLRLRLRDCVVDEETEFFTLLSSTLSLLFPHSKQSPNPRSIEWTSRHPNLKKTGTKMQCIC